MSAKLAVRVSALMGFLGVGLGAFGAHVLKGKLEALGNVEIWKTAVFYHLAHAVVMLLMAVVSLRGEPVGPLRAAGPWSLIRAGVILFSGSLYGLALGGPKILGPVTPLGGLCLLAAWMWLAVRPSVLAGSDRG